MLKAFEDPKATSRNPATLAARTGVPLAAATAFLRDQAASQITKEAHRPPDENYAPTGGPRGEYLADVIYLRESLSLSPEIVIVRCVKITTSARLSS